MKMLSHLWIWNSQCRWHLSIFHIQEHRGGGGVYDPFVGCKVGFIHWFAKENGPIIAKRMRWGTKLKLQLLAKAIAVASIFFGDSIQSHTAAFCQLGCCCWTPDMMFIVAVVSDHGLCLWFVGGFVAGGWSVGLWQCVWLGDSVVGQSWSSLWLRSFWDA